MNKCILISALFLGVLIMIKSSTNQKPRGIRNNNPLNIRENGTDWVGKVGDDGEFVKFALASLGIRAAAKVLKTYRDKYGLVTVKGIINRWAPTNENDTQSYIKSVASRINVNRHDVLTDSDYEKLIAAMIYHENGQQPYSVDVIQDGFNQGFYT